MGLDHDPGPFTRCGIVTPRGDDETTRHKGYPMYRGDNDEYRDPYLLGFVSPWTGCERRCTQQKKGCLAL